MKIIRNKYTRGLLIALAAVLLFTAAPCAYAEYGTDMQKMEVTARRLNVRQYPQTDDLPVIATLKRGDRVTLLGEEGKWSYVEWTDGNVRKQGYVFSRYIKPVGALLYFATEEVNLRSKANSKSSVLRVLQAGDSVVFIKKVSNGVQVEYQGMTGFVYGKYLTKDRRKSYLGSQFAQELGKKNIVSVEYIVGANQLGSGVIGLNNGSYKPICAIRYNLKPAYKENALYVIAYEYVTASEAEQVRRAVTAHEGTPGWDTVYFQKGSTVYTLDWSYSLRTTDREKEPFYRALEVLTALYGEMIPKK